MLKRLPILCATLLALAACSHNNDSSNSSPPAAATTTAAANTTQAVIQDSPTATAAATTAASPAPADSAATTAASAPAAAGTVVTPMGTDAKPFVDNGKWVEGKNYFLIQPAQATLEPGKPEVAEVFSYACPACNQFHATMDQLIRSLPKGTVIRYVPAAFRPDENWPLFQRAYFAAEALGVADKTYDAMFDAVWKSGELASYDLKAGTLKPRNEWTTLQDIAKFYSKYGVDPTQFVGVANSFSVNIQMKKADDLIKAYAADSTPTVVVDGKYRLSPMNAGGYPQTIELVNWLVAKDAAGK